MNLMFLLITCILCSYCWAVCKLRKRYGQQSWLKSILKRGFCLCCGIEDMDSLKSGASRSFHHLMDPSFEHIPPAQLDELELNIDQFITSELYMCFYHFWLHNDIGLGCLQRSRKKTTSLLHQRLMSFQTRA
uniref:Uncharacterized protein LOC104246275 isoform X2 n=1 Tax=Nicotiana sylvestris TaxID=4096 RepID=A0A1U7YEI0_NICSY|nr:PREDICTED: uncharacterized protein LOC104246275 isoform X2 [Nicotiana sylvestris]